MNIYCNFLNYYGYYKWKEFIDDKIILNNFLNVREIQGRNENIHNFNIKKDQWIYCSEIQLLNYLYHKIEYKKIKFINLHFKLIR